MVDKEKVAVMTKAARDEKRNHRKTAPAAEFFMFDYVLLQVIKGVLAVTLLYMALAGCYLLCTVEQWITTSTIYDLIAIGLYLGRIYGVVVLVSVLFLSLIYSLRYVQAKRNLKVRQMTYQELDRYYEE